VDFEAIWRDALTFEQFLAQARPEHRPLWDGVYRHATSPAWAADVVNGRTLRLLAISEDWCVDTSSTIPTLARVAESVPGVDLRLILRDANLDIMDRYLTNGARSIPVVIVLDGDFNEVGRWGPRPSALQAWVMANRALLPRAEVVKEERRWYARDRGETSVREVLGAIREP
jgi:hypothetical protein